MIAITIFIALLPRLGCGQHNAAGAAFAPAALVGNRPRMV
jgi:hypothetical protein